MCSGIQAFSRQITLKYRYSHLSGRFLDSFSHPAFTDIAITALATARNDGEGWSHFCKKVHHEEGLYPYFVISTGGSMLNDSAVKNRYSFEEWRNLFCVREYRPFPDR